MPTSSSLRLRGARSRIRPTRSHISDRSPAAGLHALAERERAALMVVGSSHRSSIGRIVAGGTADRLLTGASVPVAIAPAGYSAATRRIQLVGCGFDGSAESHRALTWAAEFARAASARLCILAVHEHTLPATLALNGGLATASLNDILRRQLKEQLAEAVAALDPSIDAGETFFRERLGGTGPFSSGAACRRPARQRGGSA